MNDKLKTSKLRPANRQIIGIGYKMGSGKDALADCLVKEYGYVKYRFSDPIKAVAAAMFGYTDRQMNTHEGKAEYDQVARRTVRDSLQLIGERMRNAFGADIWVRSLLHRIEESSDSRIVIPDVRYLNEQESVHLRGVTCKISRPREKRGLTGVETGLELHATEIQLDSLPDSRWHAVIDNSGDDKAALFQYAGNLVMLYDGIRCGKTSNVSMDADGLQCCTNEEG